MKHILVPTDFSNNAYNALLYATQLFSKEKVKITLAHTFENEMSRSTSRIDIGRSEEVYDRLHRDTEYQLNQVKHRITRDTEDLNCEFEMQDSGMRLETFIGNIMKAEHVDLIVMGTKGASGLKEVLVGSQSIKILKKIKSCPILLVPEDSISSAPKWVCFATDFEQTFDNKQLSVFLDIINNSESVLHIAHIYNQEQPEAVVEDNYKSLKDNLGDISYNTHWISKKGPKAKALQDFVENQEIDLLTMVYKRHSFIDNIFREPVIKNIGFHLKIPFLVLQE